MINKDIALARPLLLLLEDDPAVRRSLQMVLRGQGFQVHAHASAAMLLEDRDAAEAACLITDYRLTDMTGIEVLEILRERGWHGPAILITGHGSKELGERARWAGFIQTFEKPLRQFSLAKAVERCVRNNAGDKIIITEEGESVVL